MLSFTRKWISIAFIGVLAACHPYQRPSVERPPAQGTAAVSGGVNPAGVGETAAAQLNGWYQRRDADCGSATRPAFLCSGVTLRGTVSSPNYLPWDPSPDGLKKGGLSASWLRIDSNFPETFRPNGFIFYPPAEAPAAAIGVEVLCAFPFDGDTWNRQSLQGCGPHPSNVSRSRPCHELGITTAQQWLTNYYTPGYSRHSHQCGWDVRIGSAGTAARFQQDIQARAGLQPDQWRFTTELVIRTWPTGAGARLPIHSFFYRAGNSVALGNARYDQKRYFDLYGKALPVVSLSLPGSQAGVARFEFKPTDQAVPLPGTPDYPEVGALAPRVPEASAFNGTKLLISDFYDRQTVTVRVPPYRGIAPGQTVGAKWAGTVVYNTEIKTVGSVGSIDFAIPRMEVIDNIGRTVLVTFSVKRGSNAPIETSARLDLQVEAQPFDLPAPTIDAAHTLVSFGFPQIQPGVHYVSMRWSGVTVRDTSLQPVSHAGVQTFAVPSAWVAENVGRTVLVTVAVGNISGGRYMFSRVLRVRL